MKTLVSILLLALGVVAAIQKPTTNITGGKVIFLCQPKSFSSPQIPNGYQVVGISAQGLNVSLGDTSPIFCYFEFYRVVDSTMQKVADQNDFIPQKVQTPQGIVNLHALLTSGNKEQVYMAATIFATAQGYTLLPLNQQTHLNALYP